MARIRSIHPDACLSEKLDACSDAAERCYWRLQPHCDDEGRANDDARILRSLMFPVREHLPSREVDGWLQELHDRGLIVRYEVGGKRYLQVVRWSDYQKPQHPVASKLPAPLDGARSPHEGSGDVALGEGVGEGVGEGGRKRRPQPAFEPSESHREYATKHHLDLTEERDSWVLWCEANGKTYDKLNAGFSTWLRKAVEFGRGNGTSANGHVTADELASW